MNEQMSKMKSGCSRQGASVCLRADLCSMMTPPPPPQFNLFRLCRLINQAVHQHEEECLSCPPSFFFFFSFSFLRGCKFRDCVYKAPLTLLWCVFSPHFHANLNIAFNCDPSTSSFPPQGRLWLRGDSNAPKNEKLCSQFHSYGKQTRTHNRRIYLLKSRRRI